VQFVPFEPGIEISGQSLCATLEGFGPFIMLASQYLLAEGMGSPEAGAGVKVDKDQWYPQAAWLKAFERISQHMGDQILFQIGAALPNNIAFPPWALDIHSALKSLDVAYHQNHRRRGEAMFSEATGQMQEGIGHYGYEPVPNKKLILSLCQNPYPCAFDRGLLSSLAQRYEPTASVLHDDSRPCRRQGADSCTYLITWR
jgi:hypothetical protein